MDQNQQQPGQAPVNANPAAQFASQNPPPPAAAINQMPMGHPPQAQQQPNQAQQQDNSAGRHKASEKIQQILILFYFFVASILMLRFAFSLFGANRESPFADFVYSISQPFMVLFEGMFGGGVGVGNYQLEVEIFVALIVYALIFFGVARLIKILLK